MYYPAREEFIKLAKHGNLIPVCRDVMADFETPLSSFMRIDTGDYSFLLESVEGGERIARFSFLGSEPCLVFSSKGNSIEITEAGRIKKFKSADPIAELKKILGRYKFVNVEGLPRFSGGLVGFMGYDMVRFMEDIPDKNPDNLKLPDSTFMLTDTLLVFDHVDHKIKIISNAHIKGSVSRAYDEAVAKIDRIVKQLKTASAREGIPYPIKKKPKALKLKSNLTKKAFEGIVIKGKRYIQKGDIIQFVPSQRFETPIKAHPFQIYRALRSVNPSPYMYYLKLKDFYIVGSSPEIMVRCEDGRVELRPIAGTRPRGAAEADDVRLEKELLADPKERAEHIMLVDLGRNDIGRVCDYNSIKVSDLMTIERYSHVMHIVSDVTGRLKKDKDAFDVVRATFPAGTVTGAPKVRAMEIIDELENVRRSAYAGSVGYFSFSGNLDSCITIRTIVIKNNVAYIQVGCGVVADSKPASEYQETINKAKAMFRAIEIAEGGLE